MIDKTEYPYKSYETTAVKNKHGWLIGGDFPDYKSWHYIVISKDVEYTLKNGRMIRN